MNATSKPSSAAYPSTYPILSGRTPSGHLRVPASKSVSQRYLNLALLSRHPSTVHHPLFSEDIAHYLDAIARLGFEVERLTDRVRLNPVPMPESADIFCGAGGTMMRFMTATLSSLPGIWRLDGIPRLRERPLGPLIATLRSLGADITCLENEGFPPLRIRGGRLRGGQARLDASISSQFLSAILMAGLSSKAPIDLEVEALTSAPYVSLTLEAIARFGGHVEQPAPNRFRIVPGPLQRETIRVEGDDSAAAYPAAAAALCGGRVALEGLRRDSDQGDRGFIALLEQMGARTLWQDETLVIEGGELRAVEADLSEMPDQVPTLAALAPFAHGTTHIVNVPHLRHKESDRLSAMATELKRLGAEVTELEDGLVIPGIWARSAPPSETVEVDTHDDHRIAMSLALTGLRRPGLVIREPRVVAKSYPHFWTDLESLLHEE